MKNEYCVYVHTNKANGKRYVGITSMEPEKRWAKGSGYRSNVLFYRAIQKYGWDGFDHNILAYGLTKQEACEMEVAMIAKYDLVNPERGYNLDHGGNGTNRLTEKTRAVLSQKSKEYSLAHPENGKRLSNYAKTHRDEISERYKVWIKEHPEFSKKHGQTMKRVWAEHPEIIKKSREKCREYYNLHPEARKLKSEQTRQYFEKHPEARQRNARKTHEYYQNPEVKKWKSEERKKFFAEHPEKKPTKAVEQYSLDGVFVGSFASAREAEKATGVGYRQISAVVTGKQKTTGGYIWRYKDELQNKAI